MMNQSLDWPLDWQGRLQGGLVPRSLALLTFPRHSSARSYWTHPDRPPTILASILGNSAHYSLCFLPQLRKQGCDTFIPSAHVRAKGCISEFRRRQCERSEFGQLLVWLALRCYPTVDNANSASSVEARLLGPCQFGRTRLLQWSVRIGNLQWYSSAEFGLGGRGPDSAYYLSGQNLPALYWSWAV